MVWTLRALSGRGGGQGVAQERPCRALLGEAVRYSAKPFPSVRRCLDRLARIPYELEFEDTFEHDALDLGAEWVGKTEAPRSMICAVLAWPKEQSL